MEDPPSSMPSIWASLHSWFTPTVFFLLLNLMIATVVFTSNLPNNHDQAEGGEEEKQNSQQHNDGDPPKVAGSPSVLHRLKSFNFHPLRSQPSFSPEVHQEQEALQVAATEYVFNQPLSVLSTHFDPIRSDQSASAAAGQYDAFDQTREPGLSNAETHFVAEEAQAAETVTAHFDFDPTHQANPEDADFDEVYDRLKGGHFDRTKSDTPPASGEVPPKLPEKMKKSASLTSAFSHFEAEEIVEARRPATVRERKSEDKEGEEEDVEVDAKADDFINKFKNDLKLQRIDSIIRWKGAASRGTAK